MRLNRRTFLTACAVACGLATGSVVASPQMQSRRRDVAGMCFCVENRADYLVQLDWYLSNGYTLESERTENGVIHARFLRSRCHYGSGVKGK